MCRVRSIAAATTHAQAREAERVADEARGQLAEANRRNAALQAELDTARTITKTLNEQIDALQASANTPQPAANVDNDTRTAAIRDVLI